MSNSSSSFVVRKILALVFDSNEKTMLLIGQNPDAEKQNGNVEEYYYKPPGGKMRPRESDVDAVERKMEEETGLLIKRDTWEKLYTVTKHIISAERNFTIETSVGLCAVNEKTIPQRNPHSQVVNAQWMPYREAFELIQKIPDVAIAEPLAFYLENGPQQNYWEYSATEFEPVRTFPTLLM